MIRSQPAFDTASASAHSSQNADDVDELARLVRSLDSCARRIIDAGLGLARSSPILPLSKASTCQSAILRPPSSLATVRATEDRLGFRLPRELVRYYSSATNGNDPLEVMEDSDLGSDIWRMRKVEHLRRLDERDERLILKCHAREAKLTTSSRDAASGAEDCRVVMLGGDLEATAIVVVVASTIEEEPYYCILSIYMPDVRDGVLNLTSFPSLVEWLGAQVSELEDDWAHSYSRNEPAGRDDEHDTPFEIDTD